MRLGVPELLLILLVILLLFGARRLPDLARSLGKSIGEFKKGREDAEREAERKPDAKGPDADRSKPS